MELTLSQKLLCERIVNVFETGSVGGDYGCISIFKDGPHEIRQITYGRSQTTEYGNLQELVQMYVDAGGKYAGSLRPYVAKIGKNPLVDDATFKALLVKAAKDDPVMRSTQDAFFDKRYFKPAQAWAEEHGFTFALSMLVIYDSFVHSGGILDFLRADFPEKVPSAGGDEKTWIAQYVAARAHWLATSERTVLHTTVYRTNCFATEIKRGNWDLVLLPIFAHGVRVDASSSLSTPASKPSSTMETSMNWFGTFIMTLLGNDQIQSILRSTLKVAGTALVVKAGGDVGNIDTIVGGLVSTIGLVMSLVTHSPIANPIKAAA